MRRIYIFFALDKEIDTKYTVNAHNQQTTSEYKLIMTFSIIM